MDGTYVIHLDVIAGRPGRALSAEDARNWRQMFPHRCYLEDFSDARLALPVVTALNQARAQQFFEEIEVWARPPYESRNPELVFVGITDKHHTIIAQWAPKKQALTTSEQLQKRIDTLHRPLRAAFGFPWRAQFILAGCIGILICSLILWDWRVGLIATSLSFMGFLSTPALAEDDREVGKDIFFMMFGMCVIASAATTLELLHP